MILYLRRGWYFIIQGLCKVGYLLKKSPNSKTLYISFGVFNDLFLNNFS